jgi:hypothetical protein
MEIHDPELFALEKQVAQAMVHLKQELHSGSAVKSADSEEEAQAQQELLLREAQFFAYHAQFISNS